MPASGTLQGWQVLHLSNEIPPTPLFFSYKRREDRLLVHLTDLISLWISEADREDLLEEALKQKPSIDPSESKSQYDTFCVRLGESLGTGLNSIQVGGSDVGVNVLHVSTKLKLPKPLKPLAWTFRLEQQQQTSFARQISISALEALLQEEEHQRSLFKVIKEKDHVISKLLDKIDASGIDLGLIFPGISGSKSRRSQVSLKEASRQVPGIAAFDLEQWTQQSQNVTVLNSLNITFH